MTLLRTHGEAADTCAHPADDLLLTAKEQAITELVAYGMRNADVAAAIGTTENMVKNHLRNIFDKLGVWNRVELALWHVAHEIPKGTL
jgi:DNA-binding CsgD family transcriptional regulator